MSRGSIFALAWGLAIQPLADAASLPAVVPNPAQMSRQAGEFRVTAATPVVTAPGDAAARGVAANFTDLVARSTGSSGPGGRAGRGAA